MTTIPHIAIHRTLQSALATVAADCLQNSTLGTPQKSILWNIFKNSQYEGFDFYDQAASFFTRPSTHPRHIEVRLSFDSERANLPTVHLTMSRDSEKAQGIGMNENVDGWIQYSDETVADNYQRIFQSSFNIILTSDNTFEVILMYELIRALLIMLTPALSEMAQIYNIKVSGADLTMNPQLVPTAIFMRGLEVSFDYQIEVVKPSKMDVLIANIVRDWKINLGVSNVLNDYQ